MTTVADAVAAALAAAGVRRAFGIPGGGSSPLIRALRDQDMDFVLSRGESAAVIMASVDAENVESGPPRLGVALASLGPGAAATINGVCHARLDRSPVLVFTEHLDPSLDVDGIHQRVDHAELFRGAAKASLRLTVDNHAAQLAAAIELARTDPMGPVHVDLSGAEARKPTNSAPVVIPSAAQPELALTAAIAERIAAAQRPVAWAGLDTRGLPERALAACARALRMPVFTTYKAKGVIAGDDPWSAGVATGSVAERALFDKADLVVTIGLDPVEVVPGRPPLAEAVALSAWPYPDLGLATVVDTAVGNLAAAVAELSGLRGASEWSTDVVAAYRDRLSTQLAAGQHEHPAAVHPWTVSAVLAEYRDRVGHVTVDAGAHMFPICEGMRLQSARRFWISNGLSTMAYALPAAIALSRQAPSQAVVCCVGDGGLMMGTGELATAREVAGRLIVLLFCDSGLSLIRAKQRGAEIGLGVEFRNPDWVAVARGFGWEARAVGDDAGLRAGLDAALEAADPTLLAIRVDRGPYANMLKVIRG